MGLLHVITTREVLDRGLVLWNLLVLLILGLSTPLALEQRATIRSGQPFLIGVHELPGAKQGWIPWHCEAVFCDGHY
jgi:hypothetical protein